MIGLYDVSNTYILEVLYYAESFGLCQIFAIHPIEIEARDHNIKPSLTVWFISDRWYRRKFKLQHKIIKQYVRTNKNKSWNNTALFHRKFDISHFPTKSYILNGSEILGKKFSTAYYVKKFWIGMGFIYVDEKSDALDM